MTTMEIDRFINEVLKGFWPRWKPGDIELREWQSRLSYYDFQKAKKAAGDVAFTCSTRTIEPPNGKILDALKRFAEITKTFVKKHANQAYENTSGGLMGEQAFDKAIADILNYPVGHKTRVWLENYLDETRFKNKFEPELKAVPPVVNVSNERNRQHELLKV